jgi:DNA-binding XRE family transcriptional regulator
MEQTAPAWTVSDSPLSIAELRTELGLSLAEMGARVGLSKSQMHDIERRNAATLRVALALEALAPGRIDAAAICEEVKLARHGLADTSNLDQSSRGNSGDNFPAAGGVTGLAGAPCPAGADAGGDGSASGGSLSDMPEAAE